MNIITDYLENEYSNKWFESILQIPIKYITYDFSYHPLLTLEIIKKHPNFPWEWSMIGRVKGITMEFILNNPDKNWDWSCISTTVTMQDIINNPHKPWNLHALSCNPNLTKEMIMNRCNIVKLTNVMSKQWNWNYIYSNKNLIFDCAVSYPKNKWDWSLLTSNPNVNIGIVLKYLSKDWNWRYISENFDINIDFVKNNFFLPWNWDFLCKNKNIIIENITKLDNEAYSCKYDKSDCLKYDSNYDYNLLHKNFLINQLKWNSLVNDNDLTNEPNPENNAFWFGYTRNPNVTTDIILKYPNRYWDWLYVYSNFNVTIDFIKKNISSCKKYNLTSDLSYYLSFYCNNPNLTMDIVLSNLKENLDWNKITANNCITIHDILNNINLPWRWDYVFSYKHITVEIIKNNPNVPWDWKYIIRNPNFIFDLQLFDIFEANSLQWYIISENKYITPDIVLDNLHLPWSFNTLFINQKITKKIIEKIIEDNIDIPNFKYYLCYCNYYSIKEILRCSKEINYNFHVLKNEFATNKKMHLKKHIKNILLTKLLQCKNKIVKK